MRCRTLVTIWFASATGCHFVDRDLDVRPRGTDTGGVRRRRANHDDLDRGAELLGLPA
jgi:hypothetical protein